MRLGNSSYYLNKLTWPKGSSSKFHPITRAELIFADSSRSAVAQSVERATPGEEVVGSISTVDALFFRSVSVLCDQLRQKSWSTRSVSCVAALITSDASLGTRPRYSLGVDEETNQPKKQTICRQLKKTVTSIASDLTIIITSITDDSHGAQVSGDILTILMRVLVSAHRHGICPSFFISFYSSTVYFC